jgi:hypothetical protein
MMDTDKQLDPGYAVWERHKKHMEKRCETPGFLDDTCPACLEHAKDEQRAAEKKAAYWEQVDKSKQRMTEWRRIRHAGD